MKYKVKNNNTPVYLLKEIVYPCQIPPCSADYLCGEQYGIKNAGDIIEGDVKTIGGYAGGNPNIISWSIAGDHGSSGYTLINKAFVMQNAVEPVNGIIDGGLPVFDKNGDKLIQGLGISAKTLLIYGGIALVAWIILKPKKK